MTKFLAGDAASLEDHLVLGQRARLVAEHVLHLAELLGDVERPALDPLLVHLVPHQGVVVDEVDLGDLGQLNGYIEGEGDDNLENDYESPESQESGPKRFKLVEGWKIMERSQSCVEELNQKPQPAAPRRHKVNIRPWPQTEK